jgi:hypothetical protein
VQVELRKSAAPCPTEADLQSSAPKTWRSRIISNAETAATTDTADSVPETGDCGTRNAATLQALVKEFAGNYSLLTQGTGCETR